MAEHAVLQRISADLKFRRDTFHGIRGGRRLSRDGNLLLHFVATRIGTTSSDGLL
jgi:hypothetical protein